MSIETSTETTDPDAIELELSVEFRPRNGDRLAMRPVIFGHRPLVLIEFEATSETSVRIDMDATGFEDEDGVPDKQNLIEMLEVIIDGLKREDAVVKTEVR